MRKYADIFSEIKDMVGSLFGEQMSLSYPMPDIVSGVRVERCFLYYVNASLQRSRPVGMLMLEMSNGRLLSYQDARIADFMDTKSHPFEQPISYALPEKMGVKQFKAEQAEINELYEAVRVFAFADELTKEQREQLNRYLALLQRLTPAALMPYYQELGKSFLAWAQEHK